MRRFLMRMLGLGLVGMVGPGVGLAQETTLTWPTVPTVEGRADTPTITSLAYGGRGSVALGFVVDQRCHPQEDGVVARPPGDSLAPSVTLHAVCRTLECGGLVAIPAIHHVGMPHDSWPTEALINR